MRRHHRHESGEGRIGCLLFFVVFAIAALVAIKILPVYMHHDDLVAFARETARQAGLHPAEELQANLVAKAKNLDLPEATAPGAIVLSSQGERQEGTCSVSIRYTRKVDLYGVTTVDLAFSKSFTERWVDAR